MSVPGPFEYRGDALHCEGVPLAKIAADVGTPVYVYSHAELERAYKAFDAALEGIPHRVCYAVKANSSLGVLAVLAKLGAGADIVSAGELFRWQKAGGDPAKVVFSGVGKTDDEMKTALAAGIGCFNVESAEELEVLDRVARSVGKRAKIALRVNPDVDPETHPYISTGLKQNKFGVAMSEAPGLLRGAAKLAGLEISGVDFHIGSQLIKTAPFTDSIARLVALVEELAAAGIKLDHVDIGGGLGIDYGKGDVVPSPAEYGVAVRTALAPLMKLGVTLYTEPGRVIVGAAGALVTQVLFRKRNEAKHFTIVDAAMNDLMRPALYQAFHPMKPVTRPERPTITTDVVGPICETGDFLARDRELPELDRGELLWIGAAGAYGATMASNYNTRPRAPEVLVRGNSYTVIRARETYEHLIAGERIG
ncbi:MAG: diaminopimelate decarboxylase [Deltaproteobacteria bacterium]|nr:diaminopimelate decarboxylase [Deltaproteobacteria bacterium]MDQ3296299.1 diaminopimelate decarboxylase [Myxococcota bacterium]